MSSKSTKSTKSTNSGKNSRLEIKLVRSTIGCKPKHRLTARVGLGLKKINSVVIRANDPCIRGMINQISYLLEVKEIN